MYKIRPDENSVKMIDSFEMARRRTSLVITAGDTDFNRNEACSMYYHLMRMQFMNIHYIQEPGRGHAPLTGMNFDRAVRLPDARKR